LKKTLVIMAAGMGTRYGGLKQLDPIGPFGETIIDYSVYDALRAGFSKVVFIIRKDIEKAFKEQIGQKFSDMIAVSYAFQSLSDIPDSFSVPGNRSKPWGTGHALLSAAEVVNDPFIVINADDFYGADAFRKASEYLDSIDPLQMKAALVGFLLKNTLSEHGSVARGICKANDKGSLDDVEEILGIKRNSSGKLISENRENLHDDDIVSMNMWAFSPVIFDFTATVFSNFLEGNIQNPTAEFYIPIIVNSLINDEGLNVTLLETESLWYGVTYREDKPLIVSSIKNLTDKGLYPLSLWEQK